MQSDSRAGQLGPAGEEIANINNFPWKKLGTILAKHDITMDGFPEGVPMPSHENTIKSAASSTRSKGLAGLSAPAMKKFVDAFIKPHKSHPIRFEMNDGLRAGNDAPQPYLNCADNAAL